MMIPDPTHVVGTENGDSPRRDIPSAVTVTTDGRAAATTSAMSAGSLPVPVTTAFGVGDELTPPVGAEPAIVSRAPVDPAAMVAERIDTARSMRSPRGRVPASRAPWLRLATDGGRG